MDVQHAIELAASDSDRYIEGSEGGNDFGFYFQPSDEHISRIILSPDRSLLAAAFETNPLLTETRGITNRVDVFDYADLFAAGETDTQPEPIVSIPDAKNAYFSPDSQWLMTDTGLWDTTSGQPIAEISSGAAAFSPANDIVATVDPDGVRLWSIGDLTAGETTPLVSLPVAAVQAVGFSPDGRLLYLKRAGDVAVWGIQR
ncbi:MAG: hypothetical protein K8I30_10925 [Anaerolineae bacterium]|nr:hypothetical protein [Anaerolineae bacterium]